MSAENRSQLRKMFFSAWQKRQSSIAMEPIEEIIANIVQQHPEYHHLLDNEQDNIDKDYLPENGDTNPFLHMAMHISIHEQLASQRPVQLTQIYQQLLTKYHDSHEVEHHMMDCLAEMIRIAQHENNQPDESTYVICLESLIISNKR